MTEYKETGIIKASVTRNVWALLIPKIKEEKLKSILEQLGSSQIAFMLTST